MLTNTIQPVLQSLKPAKFEVNRLRSWLSKAESITTRSEAENLPLAQLTDEQAELFRLMQNCSVHSRFIRAVAEKQPHKLLTTIEWHLQHHEADYLSALANELQENFDFNGSNASVDLDSLGQSLRRLRYRHAAALACLNFSGLLPINRCSIRMSLLAEGIIQWAYRGALHSIRERHGEIKDEQGEDHHLLILAMGKLGSFELNFSSDIDLIFFYQDGPESTPIKARRTRPLERNRYWQKVATELIHLLNTHTADGFCFRTDMRLRPYGESGALVMSLAQAEDYYQEQGRDWERYAMIRARCLTGNAQERERLQQIIRPFTFRRYIDFSVLDSIREMKAMIEREVRVKGLEDNIKLGAGGIREVEFVVQALQLIKGGRESELQQSHLLLVLPLLADKGLLQKDDCKTLADAFLFLRRLEDLIQALDERHSQNLPTSAQEQASIAFAMGFANYNALLESLQDKRQRVREIFASLLSDPEKQVSAAADWSISLWQTGLDAESLQRWLAHLSLAECEGVIDALSQFKTSKTTLALSRRGLRRLNHFMPLLLTQWGKQAASLQSLQRLLKVLRAVMRRTAYLELLAENPPVLEQLVFLAAKSDWVVERLAAYPILFDELLYPSRLYQPLDKQALVDELRQSLLRIEQDDEEQQMNQLRSFKQSNELRVAAAMLNKKMDVSEVSRYLTLLAESLLEAALNLAWEMVCKKFGQPPDLNEADRGFAIVGYGKLGGTELSFSSDLDIVFLFNQPVQALTEGGERAIECGRFYTRLAQKLIHILSTRTHLGVLYEVDTRLRPSGNSGLLVSHVNAYEDYQMNEAWIWEHQALVRARVVVGDIDIAKSFEKTRQSALKRCAESPAKIYQAVYDMREKMRRQLLKKDTLDLKQMPGGMVDIEFLAQLFALLSKQEMTPTRTTDLLQQMIASQWLSPEQGQLLLIHYKTLRDEHNWRSITGQWSAAEIESTLRQQSQQVFQIWQQIFNDKIIEGAQDATPPH